MKKIFFYSSLLALATSCTDEFDSLGMQNEKAQGISFKSEIVESRMLWEDEGSSYSPFWYAEVDRINVYGAGCLAVGDPLSTTSPLIGENKKNGYAHIVSAPAIYKATQSKKNGVFTSLDIDQTYSFAGDKEAAFVATYPTDVTATPVAAKPQIQLNNWLPAEIQVQKGLKGDNKSQVMYSLTKATRENAYDAVGETVSLDFKRPLKALVFTTENADEYTVAPVSGNSIFGNLVSISFETKGIKVNDDADYTDLGEIAPTALSYSDATLVVDTMSMAATITNSGTDVRKITLNINQEWNDDALAIMAVVPNERTKYTSVNEPVEVLYNFENITLTHTFKAIPRGAKINGYVGIPALNVQDYPYLVTKGSSGAGRTLIVNGGEDFTFADIFNAANKVKWNDEFATGSVVELSSFTKVIVDSDVILSPAEFAILSQFDNLESLTLKGNTSIPANAFSQDLADNLTELNLPLVTSIDATGQKAFKKLVNLDINSYEFANEDVHPLFFNDDVKSTLQTLKIEAVTSLRPTFGYDRTIYFTDYAALEEIALNPNGVAVPAFGFKNCSALTSVTGKVDISNAPEAFYGAGDATTNPTINVMNTIIPNAAFQSANVKDIKYQGAQVVPTEIGESAFRQNSAIEVMDLSNATTIGAYAFSGASNFVGNKAAGKVLTVGAKVLNDFIFNGTKIVRVQFTAAQTLGNQIFGTNVALKQVKFLARVKEVTLQSTDPDVYSVPFKGLTPANIDLFVKTNQSDINGLKWNLTGDTFKSVTKENVAFGE